MRASHDSEARERGATLVEYALIVALIVLFSLGAISFVQSNGEEQLASSDQRIGNQADDAYYPGVATTSSVPGTTSTTAGAVNVHLAPNPTVTITDDPPGRWRVTVTFTIVDSSGNGVIGATMTGTWTDVGQGSSPSGTCTTSTSAGQCTIQYTKIKDNDKTVSYQLDSISGSTFVWVPAAPDEGHIVATCASPVC